MLFWRTAVSVPQGAGYRTLLVTSCTVTNVLLIHTGTLWHWSCITAVLVANKEPLEDVCVLTWHQCLQIQ
jgi:hypothetical protein